jgi:ABC-2 type transport system permease protein
MIFGLAVSALVVFAGLVMGTPIMRLGSLVLGIVVSSGTFASLGVLFSTIPTQEVSAVMMPATLVRWPLLFVSGLFVPIDALPAWGRLLAYASPLTYTKDLCEGAMGGAPRLPPLLSFAALLGYWGGFLLLGLLLHEFGRRRT